MKKAALHNLGCKVNAYETEAMQQILADAGYEIVDFKEKADVYVINTCSVTNIADRKSRQMIHRAKNQNPDAILVAAGCYVQTSEEEAKADPTIDILLGNNQKDQLLEKIRLVEEQRGLRVDAVIDINDGVSPYETLHLSDTAEHTRAFIKIQDGCNQFCTYCIIPYARGRVRSRNPESVIEEVEKLAQKGFREIVLTGIHLSSYGIDIGTGLLEVIERINEIEGIERIRLGSLEPRLVTEEFAEKLSSLPKICPHFHLSLQSGCDDTLKRMNRKYTTEEYRRSCELLRKYFDQPAITTDVIVGFPGESAEDFEITRKYLEEIHFYEMHVFPYSRRKGTPADRMENQIPESVKKERSHVLLALEKEMSDQYRSERIGKETEVLMEEKYRFEGKDYFIGFTKTYVKVAVPADRDYTNQLVCGRITGFLDDSLMLMETESGN